METRKQIHVGAVHAIAKAPDSGVWASADRAGNLYYWSDVGSTTARLLRTGRVVATLAFASSQRLFVTTMKNETGDAYVELWDLSGRRKLDELKLATGDHLLASAVSPDGSCFATPSDDGSISLFPLKDDQGNFLSRPFTDGSPVPIAGSTRKLYRVAFDSNSTYRLGMSTIPTEDSWETLDAKLTHGFDLKEVQIYDPAANLGKWRSGSDNASNWRVTRSNSDYSVELRNGAVRKLIHLDPSLQGLAECYAWISDATGAPYAIAIGTSQHGIFVYSVSVANECRLLRHFRDHYGQVTSLCVSADGRYLASASVDGSAKIWSLNGLNAPGREFSQEAGWGAVFRKKGANTLTVGGVDSAGIIARRGINPGDEILKVVYEGNGGFAEANTADGMFRALENTKLWQTVILSVQKPGDRRSQAILLKPAWEPVASLVLDNRNEWVMWTPQGFYNASAGGDELIGWILNDKHDHPVARFFQADRFRRELEKPEVMKNLLTARSLPAAFQTAKQQLPTDLQDGVSPVVKRLPRVEIESPLPNEQLASGRTIEAKANFVFTNEEDIDNYELALYVNGIPAQKPKKKDIHGNVVTLTWNVVPPNERNLVRVVASQKSGNSVGDYSDARVSVRAKTTPYKPNLYYVGIAANDYPGRLKLEYCRDDVSDVLGLLQGGATRHFRLAQDNISLMFDQKVTKESIDQLPDQLQSQFQSIDPRDVLIVYVAGHGATKVANRENPEYYFITIDAIENTGNANGARAAAGLDHSIPWSTIRQIADLPCRKIFMIDTCFEADTPRLKASDMAKTADSLKYAVRPLRQRETMVITGCSLGQSSYQSKAFAHGLFTQAVLESLQGFADGHGDSQNKDRTIELRELTNYVLTRVPSLAEAAETKGRQTPTVSNTELGYLPLVDY
ncbi:caspase family protein [Blastopirellula sp. JC732]|uniref:Caspase family protein n=1 Tax=Blastopirellula sediminis TaxID=2894196 RepID=A0A9X1MKY3_9BACT|nr:caspase family protein [Blastopirellula sediminis]MCC9628629.1 caspase family protein [Blastopirellula sediminis]